MTSKSQEIDCQEAARRLHELLDGELTAAVEEAVRRHLEACGDCMAVFEFEEAFKRLIAIRGSVQEAPQNLKHRILNRLYLQDRPSRE